MQILKVEQLKSYYILDTLGKKQYVKSVDNIDLSIETDEIYGIAGESGCGKSTLIKSIYGVIEPPLNIVGGNIYFNIDNNFVNLLNLNKNELKKIRWEYISYIPQASMSVLNPLNKIYKTFEEFIKTHKEIRTKNDMTTLIEEHIKLLGLPLKVLDSYPHQLSGGMRQRIIVALATILHPKIIVADEPTTALDVVMQRGVIQLLKNIQKNEKNTIIIVTHDMGIHANISDRIGIMYAGKIIEEAKKIELFENPLHPYTKYLIASLPQIGDKSYRISAPGSPPSLINPPTGCRFYPRCNNRIDACRDKVPKLLELIDGHKVACFLYSEVAEHAQ